MSGTQKMAIQKHNQTVLDNLDEGDLIEFDRGRYSHWGVYVGQGQVVHLTGDGNDGINASPGVGSLFTICGREFNKANVKLDDFWNVALDSKAVRNNGKDRKCSPSSADQIIERAMSKIGRIGYNVLWKNCEHFAAWCRYDVEWSEQANKFLTWLSLASVIGSGLAMIFGAARNRRHQQS